MDRPRRPFGIAAIVALLLISAGGGVADAIAQVSLDVQSAAPGIGGLAESLVRGELAQVVEAFVVGIASLVGAVGLLRLSRWAWVLVMLIVGVGLAEDLWRYFAEGARPYVSMAFDVALVFYLNQRDVQRAFGQRQRRDRLLDVPVRHA